MIYDFCMIMPTVYTKQFSYLYILSAYSLYLDASPNLDFDSVNEYLVTISCTDNKAPSVLGEFKLFLRRNVPPVINNLTPSRCNIASFDMMFS